MISFPNCKINLGLRVLQKRTDGYHDIETVFYPVNWYDCLEFVESHEFSFESSGREIAGDSANNLCYQAYELLKAENDLPPIHIHLLKNIPMGAGLGGGSSDGAFMMKMLNEHFNLKLETRQLETLSAKLGNDCPFFINNKPVFATGTGTEFTEIEIDLASYQVAIIYPGIHVGTPEAYRSLTPANAGISISEILSKPIESWKDYLKNDFEKSVFPLHPMLQTIKSKLYDCGAVYASMSGSGSAVFGIIRPETDLSEIHKAFDFPEEDVFVGTL